MKGLVATGGRGAVTLVLTAFGFGAVVRVCAEPASFSPPVDGNNNGDATRTLVDLSLDEMRVTDRQLQRCGGGGPPGTGNPSFVRDRRTDAIQREFIGSDDECHDVSTDTDTAAKFHKTLPHDDLGRVDPEAYSYLLECVSEGDYDACERVPAGDRDGYLINPVAGVGVDIAGAASSANSVPAAPTLDSPELAAQLAECYWMSLTRDVPFSKYDTNSLTIKAAANLARMPGFASATGVSVGNDGSVDPSSQLFRASFVGVETGPMISQLLVHDFSMDSITVSPRQTTFVRGVNYMTDYNEWLRIQNGGAPGRERTDSTKRYIRNARDLSRLAATDTIYSEAFRGALILLDQGAISKAGFNGPYSGSSRQVGFVGFGDSHVMKLLGECEAVLRTAWYQKWQVHLFARPEALAGTVHNTLIGALHAPIHDSLLNNRQLLRRVAKANRKQNRADRAKSRKTYLLSQATKGGSPSHPSYPAGHAVRSGAFATALKAIVGLGRGDDCFRNPVYPDDDGIDRLSYNGDCLTYAGEINKFATNVSIGRQMMGVHYRMDSTEGMILGETVAIRLLHQQLMTYPEKHSYEFKLFTGEIIELKQDGTFSIDGSQCGGEVYSGVGYC